MALASAEPAMSTPYPTVEDLHNTDAASQHGDRSIFTQRLKNAAKSRTTVLPNSLLKLVAKKQRQKKRRSPITAIAPGTLLANNADRGIAQPMVVTKILPDATLHQYERPVRKHTVVDDVGEEYLRRLHALFHICDADEDGFITLNELVVLLQFAGASELDARESAVRICAATAVQARPIFIVDDFAEEEDGDAGVSFENLLMDCRDLIARCAVRGSKLPSRAFVHQCRSLKKGFQNCDTDGSLTITRTELEIAFQKLSLMLQDEELERVMQVLDRNNDGKIEWSEFLYAAWTNSLDNVSATLQQFFSIDLFADLPSFIRFSLSPSQSSSQSVMTDQTVKVASKHTHRAMVSAAVSILPKGLSRRNSTFTARTNYLTQIEQISVRMLTRASEQRVVQAKRASVVPSVLGSREFAQSADGARAQRRSVVLGKAPTLRRQARNGISADERRGISRLETLAILIGAAAGIVFGLVAIALESLLPQNTDEDPEHGDRLYYLYVVVLNIVVSFVEVHVLYLTTVVCAFRLTVCANLILYPLDREREFLTRSIARAALQVGYRKDMLFGIDPMKGSPRIVVMATFLMYKSKRYMLKFLLKLLIKRVLWRAAARTALSLLVLPINGLTNAWTLSRVMRNCRVSIIGPSCAVAALEVFFLEDDCFAPYQRVDYMRALGCCLVCKRSIHPNVEIMLAYMRHKWLRADMWPSGDGCSCLSAPEASCPIHPLDDTDRFVASLELYGALLDTRPVSTKVVTRGRSTRAISAHVASTRRDQSVYSEANGQGRRQPMGLSVRHHVRNIFFLLIVTLIIDGSLDWSERSLYVRCCQAAGVLNRWSRVLQLKDAFVAGRGIDVDTVFALIDREAPRVRTDGDHEEESNHEALAVDSLHVPLAELLMYGWNRLGGLLSC